MVAAVTPASVVLVAAAGFVAGAMNAIAGGGTLLAFPALLATGMTARMANIVSTIGLVPGYAGGSLAYRRELEGQGSRVRALGLTSVIGGGGPPRSPPGPPPRPAPGV